MIPEIKLPVLFSGASNNTPSCKMDDLTIMTAHTIMLAVGWLVLIPFGIWMASVGKSRYPGRWFCWHVTFMALAAALILSAAVMAFYMPHPHFSKSHCYLNCGLNALLILQAIVGVWIHYHQYQGSRPAINKAHRASGLVLYLGGLVNGLWVIHLYISGMACNYNMYGFAILFGFVIAVELMLMRQILPAWWKNTEEDQHLHLPLIGDVNVNVPHVGRS